MSASVVENRLYRNASCPLADGDFDRLPALAARSGQPSGRRHRRNELTCARAGGRPRPASFPSYLLWRRSDRRQPRQQFQSYKPRYRTTFTRDALGKTHELLNEIVTGLTDIALLVNPNNAGGEPDQGWSRHAKNWAALHVLNAAVGRVESAFAEIGSSNAKPCWSASINSWLVFRDRSSRWRRILMPTMHGSIWENQEA